MLFHHGMGLNMKLDRRQFTGAMISTLFLSRGWTDPSELPRCPKGFSWTKSHALEAYVPCPEGWFFREVDHNGSKSAYFTREDYASTDEFLTGFVVNVVRGIGGDVSTWCNAFVNACLEGIEPLERIQDDNSNYFTYGVEKINPPGGYRTLPSRIRIVGVGNKHTNALYLVQFESPASLWEADWKIGDQIYQMFKINDNV